MNRPARPGIKPAAKRRGIHGSLLIALLCAATHLAPPASADNPGPAGPASPLVEVFTDTGLFPLANTQGAKIYDLSAPKRLADALSRGLPGDPRQAQAEAAGRFAAQKQNLAEAYAGHAQAVRYGLAKIPAAVFNQGEAVVYGITDVAEAAAIYWRWKAAR
jgi:integrating conjugative element protein (TIGR03757 family)